MENSLLIDGVFVPVEILTTRFQCDISKCHGACCYAEDMGVEGCPVTQEEATQIRRFRGELAEQIFSSAKRRAMVRTKPLYTYRRQMPFRIRLEGARCIFCDNDGCALKPTHQIFSHLPDQPISCALYPICEEWDYDEQKPYLFLEHYFDETYCKAGYTLGEKTGTYLIDFCKDALVRRFGEDFFKHLKDAQHDFI